MNPSARRLPTPRLVRFGLVRFGPGPFRTGFRVGLVAFGLALVLTYLTLIDVNLLVTSVPVPAAGLLAFAACVGAFAALRLQSRRIDLQRARARRRRDVDALLRRQRDQSVRN